MRISVVIPVWNRRALIGRALDSVIEQTHPADEIIVVDDGSDDDTSAFIAERYPDVTLLSQANLGVSAARNLGIGRASGDWIALLDSDDEWLSGKLAAQSRLISERPDVRICHTDEIWIRDGRRVNPKKKHAKPDGEIFSACLPLCCVSPSSVLIHRDVFDTVGLFDESLPACEDYDLWLRIFARYPVALVPEALVRKHGGHDDQLSQRFWGMDRFRVAALDKLLESGVLSETQTRLARETLLGKCEILVAGCNKHGRYETAERFTEIADRWRC